MDYPWKNGVLIEKVGDPKISLSKIPEDWTPPPLKTRKIFFENVDNPGK